MQMNKYYKIIEIAELLEVSKTAIQKTIKAADIEPDKKERNKYYYGVEKTKQIIRSIRPDFDFSFFDNSQTKTDNSTTEISNKTDNSQTKSGNQQEESDNSTTKTDNSQTESGNSSAAQLDHQIIQELQRTIAIFENELKEKNEQLKNKDKQIETLNNTIQMLNDTIQGQLLLNAQEKKLIEAENSGNAAEKEPEQKKKSFFKRFFGKSY